MPISWLQLLPRELLEEVYLFLAEAQHKDQQRFFNSAVHQISEIAAKNSVLQEELYRRNSDTLELHRRISVANALTRGGGN